MLYIVVMSQGWPSGSRSRRSASAVPPMLQSTPRRWAETYASGSRRGAAAGSASSSGRGADASATLSTVAGAPCDDGACGLSLSHPDHENDLETPGPSPCRLWDRSQRVSDGETNAATSRVSRRGAVFAAFILDASSGAWRNRHRQQGGGRALAHAPHLVSRCGPRLRGGRWRRAWTCA